MTIWKIFANGDFGIASLIGGFQKKVKSVVLSLQYILRQFTLARSTKLGVANWWQQVGGSKLEIASWWERTGGTQMEGLNWGYSNGDNQMELASWW